VYVRLPHPIGEGNLLFFDPARLVETAVPRQRAPVARRALGALEAPPEDEVRTLERRLRRLFAGRARVSTGWALWWLLLGPALAVLWINAAPLVAVLFGWLPPLAALIATLGGVAGGPVLAAIVALVPLAWAWRRALGYARAARRWNRLAAVVRGRRYRDAPLASAADPGLAAVADETAPALRRLHEVVPTLAETGADGAAEAAELCRAVYRTAVRHGFTAVAAAYHALYVQLSLAEQRLGLTERKGGVLAERKTRAEAARTRRALSARLGLFSPRGGVSGRYFAPLLGVAAGAAALGLTFLACGTFLVPPDEAIVVDPPQSHVPRLLRAVVGAIGFPTGHDEATPVETVRTTGLHLGWPRPFAARHAVTLEDQTTVLQARFRESDVRPDSFDVVQVQIHFRIADLDRWAPHDRDASGVDQLTANLSAVLERLIQDQRRAARQEVVQQTPALANDPDEAGRRADALVETRLESLVRAYVQALGQVPAVQDAGVQVSSEFQSRLVRGIPAALAGPGDQG
jgi:hypothetical protein